MSTTTPTRAELIALCEAGVVPEAKWRNRDTAGAQIQLGQALALLRAECDYAVATHPKSTDSTWWVDITWRGFAHFDWDGGPEDDTFYIPTAKRLQERDGDDWY